MLLVIPFKRQQIQRNGQIHFNHDPSVQSEEIWFFDSVLKCVTFTFIISEYLHFIILYSHFY